MATNIGFVLSAAIALGIILIGVRFLLAPATAAEGYGMPAGTEPSHRAYLFAKGIRDIASGLFIAILILSGPRTRLAGSCWRLPSSRLLMLRSSGAREEAERPLSASMAAQLP